jgi:hypothetical protein
MNNWHRPTKATCPYKAGEFVCRDGSLWALTYSECAPPYQRQAWGPCPHCNAVFESLDGERRALS